MRLIFSAKARPSKAGFLGETLTFLTLNKMQENQTPEDEIKVIYGTVAVFIKAINTKRKHLPAIEKQMNKNKNVRVAIWRLKSDTWPNMVFHTIKGRNK